MGEFDDLIRMGEMVDKLGEAAPSPAPAAPAPAPAAAPQDPEQVTTTPVAPVPTVIDSDDGFTGHGAEFGAAKPKLDLDAILGLTPAKEEAPEPSSSRKPDAEPPAAPAGGSLEARVKELTERNRRLEEQQQRFVEKALGGQPDGAGDGAGAAEEAELSPDILGYMKPYVQRLLDQELGVGQRLSDVERTVRPLRGQAEDAMLAQEIGKYVDGFKPAEMPKLRQVYDALPEEKRAIYGQGVAGAVLLAKEIAGRGAPGPLVQPKNPSPASRRFHSETSGQPLSTARESEKDKIARLIAQDPAMIRNIVDRMEG